MIQRVECPNEFPDEQGIETLLPALECQTARPRPNEFPDEQGIET